VTGVEYPAAGLGMRTHYCGALREADIGAEVAVCG